MASLPLRGFRDPGMSMGAPRCAAVRSMSWEPGMRDNARRSIPARSGTPSCPTAGRPEGRGMADAPYRRVHVIVNPASGKDEPILNVLNDVFHQHEVEWDVSVTHKYGDAAARPKARRGRRGPRRRLRRRRHAARDRQRRRRGRATRRRTPDADGHPARRHGQRLRPGDGRARTPCARPPRSSAPADDPRRRRGPARDLGQAETSRTATSSSGCTSASSPRSRRVGSSRTGTACSRYLVNAGGHARDTTAVQYRAELDGEPIEFEAAKVYVINSGMMGTGLQITQTYAVDDGLLDCFMIDGARARHAGRGGIRFLDLPARPRGTTGSAARSGSRPSPTSPSGRTASTSGARR